VIAGDLILRVLEDALWSGIAALGFAILFNVPKRTLLACALCGAAGHAARTLLMEFGNGIEVATLVGATLVGFMSTYCARQCRAPAPIFAICGAIPMVPGTFAYRAMIGFIQVTTADAATGGPVLTDAGINFVKTGLILATIAAGIAAPTLLFRRRKPVV
jgi:uncharacterized membrane protein YjjB (DUF3815 family)